MSAMDRGSAGAGGVGGAPVRRGLALRVLASGSAGNCSVLVHDTPDGSRVTLIDLGLSPRRTRRLLSGMGLDLDAVDDVLVTHLDTDHFQPTWLRKLPAHVRVRMARGHAQRLGADVLDQAFDEPFDLGAGLRCSPLACRHDAEGVTVFRFDAPGASLGYATDVGRVTDELVAHLAGVDLLAIESNYCPVMQEASPRPERLKRRIMGGSGHLSNEQSARAAHRIAPRSDVVLLHLSRQCNSPERAARHHAGAPWRLTITSQDSPAPWVAVEAQEARAASGPSVAQLGLFAALASA